MAEQTVLNGKDSENVAVIVFNEKQGSMDVSVVDIHRIIESGGILGGTEISIAIDIPQEAINAYEKAREGFVGFSIRLKAFIGTQTTYNKSYIFIGEIESMTSPKNVAEAAIITVTNNKLHFERILESGHNDTLGYAFN